MNKFFLFSSLLLILFTKSISAQEKIVFIDMNYILNNSSAGKDLKLQLKEKNDKIKIKSKKYQNEINQKKEKLLAQKNVLSSDDFENKLKEIQNEIVKINKLMSKEDKNLNKFKQKIEKEYFKNLNPIIEKYSIENSIGIILNKKDLLMAKNTLDITQEIFNLFNNKIDKLKVE
tara:strand:- start:110 stop:631 length:522 start_codon:yes stop_codon:yes gene_type:complete